MNKLALLFVFVGSLLLSACSTNKSYFVTADQTENQENSYSNTKRSNSRFFYSESDKSKDDFISEKPVVKNRKYRVENLEKEQQVVEDEEVVVMILDEISEDKYSKQDLRKEGPKPSKALDQYSSSKEEKLEVNEAPQQKTDEPRMTSDVFVKKNETPSSFDYKGRVYFKNGAVLNAIITEHPGGDLTLVLPGNSVIQSNMKDIQKIERR